MTQKEKQPIALYNSSVPELIGIFSCMTFATKYIYPNNRTLDREALRSATRTKGRMHKTRFDFVLSPRYANTEQVKLLSDHDYILMEGYDKPVDGRMKGIVKLK